MVSLFKVRDDSGSEEWFAGETEACACARDLREVNIRASVYSVEVEPTEVGIALALNGKVREKQVKCSASPKLSVAAEGVCGC